MLTLTLTLQAIATRIVGGDEESVERITEEDVTRTTEDGTTRTTEGE
jgi:hypothetical protein